MKNLKKQRLLFFWTQALFQVLLISCNKEQVSKPPALETQNVGRITLLTAHGGGNITSDGGAPITARGVCWSIAPGPTVADAKTEDSAGTGSFESSLNGLTENTIYYVRAYATNGAGTAYGSEISFSTFGVMDIDGNGYHYVTIGTQAWMKENLKTTKYQDGTEIPNITSADDWAGTWSGAYSVYNNSDANLSAYGRLYNWYAVTDTRQLCPSGWHAPSDDEWDVLVDALGGAVVAGGKMKSTGTLQSNTGLWYSPNEGGTDESGFDGLPAGFRGDTMGGLPFVFSGEHSYGNWWSTNGDASMAWFRSLQDTKTNLDHYENYSRNGKSVRCVRD